MPKKPPPPAVPGNPARKARKPPIACRRLNIGGERLDGIFLDNAKERYTREILFSTVCDLMLGVILSIHAAETLAKMAVQLRKPADQWATPGSEGSRRSNSVLTAW